jgi:hypothetical protein
MRLRHKSMQQHPRSANVNEKVAVLFKGGKFMKYNSGIILDIMLSLEDWTWNRDLKDRMIDADPTIDERAAAVVLKKHCHIRDFEYRKGKGEDLLEGKKIGRHRWFRTKPELLKQRKGS